MTERLRRYRDDGVLARAVSKRGDRSESPLGFFGPALVRTFEYGLVTFLAWRGVVPAPLGFLYLLAVAFHHYETVYRARTTGELPPDGVDLAGLGWEGRTLIVMVAAAVGAASPTLWVVSVWCLLLFVGEATSYWLRRWQRAATGEGAEGL